jgi:hypothetical protein
MKSSRWSKTAALGCTPFLALSTFLALGLGAASVASAQGPPICGNTRDPNVLCWPNTTGAPVLQENYSDIPWTQKLGTYRGNEFDEALVLPFPALQGLEGTQGPNGTIQNIKYCTTLFGPQPQPPTSTAGQSWAARCMIETGINNIVGTLRTDTLYDKTNPAIVAAKRCPDNFDPNNPQTCTDNLKVKYCQTNPSTEPSLFPCIEVKLQVAGYWTRSYDGTSLKLEQRPIGDESKGLPNFGGLVFTDGTTFAPQMGWYMSHYCDSKFPATADVNDAVCYADYFSSFNDGFNNTGSGTVQNTNWPNSNAPWSVFPSNPLGPPNHCAPNTTTPPNVTVCTIALAGFDLAPPSSDQSKLGFPLLNSRFLKYTGTLPPGPPPPPASWFNNALAAFATNVSAADLVRHFPWDKVPQLTWADLSQDAVSNPFLGGHTIAPPDTSGCVVTTVYPGTSGSAPCPTQPTIRRADHFLYPRQCALADLANFDPNASKLRQCGVNYELHPNGWLDQWPAGYPLPDTISRANQYGRTMFLLAGVPGMQMPVSYYKGPPLGSVVGGLSVYERVHNSSVFSLYLPIANEADTQMAMGGRNYTDGSNEFYHDVLMSNHMEFAPGDFAEGIRGKVLWHNEYRSKLMYNAANGDPPGYSNSFPTFTFPAAFDPAKATAPFHNYHCDSCHVRNGSGIPINTDNKLAVVKGGAPLSPFMNPNGYTTAKDYTFTGTIHPMKLVFFDLARRNISNSVYSNPAAFAGIYYANPIMNFYGDSFRVTQPGKPWSGNYSWTIDPIDTTQPHVEVVDASDRINSETGQKYLLRQVNLGPFTTPDSASCQLNAPPSGLSAYWPSNCAAITGDKITASITSATNGPPAPGNPGGVGYMLLNGKRLGNLGAMEAIPNGGVAPQPPAMSIRGFQQSQIAALVALGVDAGVAAKMAGAIAWNVGTRAGNINPRDSANVKLACNPNSSPSLTTCWIGRFGWIGDRVSLEDQVANAAFIEMGVTSSSAYTTLYPGGTTTFPLRYKLPNCGLADKLCIDLSKMPNPPNNGNSDLTEQDVNRMADYARWLGSPTRSEFTAALPLVIAGEQVFRNVGCNSCHVIDKIPITDPNDTMMPPAFRNRLAVASPASPFLSYLGTDLLMHDMGYLSQVGLTSNLSIRDPKTDLVFDNYVDYIQKIRTPALKGLRFNRFVTDSFLNAIATTPPAPPNPACDFLLHDGRACDAIQAAFLHDGPEIKKLGVIGKLNKLSAGDLQALRAFLYSL